MTLRNKVFVGIKFAKIDSTVTPINDVIQQRKLIFLNFDLNPLVSITWTSLSRFIKDLCTYLWFMYLQFN